MSELGHTLQSSGSLVRVSVLLEVTRWHSYASESLCAEPLKGGEYRIDSIPFCAYGLSSSDVIHAEEVEGLLTFESVVARGGHSTYRFYLREGLDPDSLEFRCYWAPIGEAGCSYEGAFRRLFAIDVPPEVDVYRVYRVLEQGENAGVWEFEEGHCGHPVGRANPE